MSDICQKSRLVAPGLPGGSCCCNCRFQFKARKPPWVREDFHIGYACVVHMQAEGDVFVFDIGHGLCEGWMPAESKK